METILKMHDGSELTVSEWIEEEPPVEDKFLEWEAVRAQMGTIGDLLAVALTQLGRRLS